MPRAPARIRKRFIEGQTEVLDWETEETILYGYPLILDTLASFRAIDQFHGAWNRWRDVVLPKCIKYRPGTRPVAQYVCGEIPRRELRTPLPEVNGWKYIDVRDRSGNVTRHYLDVPEPFMEPEAKYLHRLGIVDANELREHRAWQRGDRERYPLEMSLYD
jgi:hypothetical protein